MTGPHSGENAATAALLDTHLPVYDLALTEHLAVDADAATAFQAARELDFLSVRTPLLTAAFFLRGVPSRLIGKRSPELPELRLASDQSMGGLPGWLVLGEVPNREIAFGAVGKFWRADIEWRDVPLDAFAAFDEPGWGKIGCHFLIRPNGAGRSVVSYECRTSTTDREARKKMMRYWWIIRPFVGHIMRATLRAIDANVGHGPPAT